VGGRGKQTNKEHERGKKGEGQDLRFRWSGVYVFSLLRGGEDMELGQRSSNKPSIYSYASYTRKKGSAVMREEGT
jgi:hypothetical protein